MNRDSYAIALNNAIAEINKAYPDIKNSFLFTKTGSIITGDQESDEETMNSILESFESMNEKAKVIGDLKSVSINGKNGNLTLCNINDVYLVLAASKDVDRTQIYAITNVIFPTILKTLEAFTPMHLQ